MFFSKADLEHYNKLESGKMYTSFNATNLGSDPYESLSSTDIRRLNYPKWAHRIVGTFLSVLWCVGLFLNSSVLTTFFKNKKLWSPTNTFIIGLSLADSTIILFGVPWSIMNALNGSWFTGPKTCTLEAFVLFGSGMSACYMLTSISIDRYIAIVKPLKAQLITQNVAVRGVALCFFGGYFWAILPLLGLSSYGLEAPGVSCGLDFEDKSLFNSIYNIAIFIFTFLLPLLIMAFCYVNVYRMVRQIARSNFADPKSKEAEKNLKIEKKTLKSSVIMCGVFWICWIPYAIVSFWASFGDRNVIPIAVTAIPAAAAKTSFVWNPLIYVATNQRFRLAFYDLLPCSGLRDTLVKREYREQPQQSKTTASIGEKEQSGPANGQPKVVEVLKPPEIVGPEGGESSSEQTTTIDEIKSSADITTDKHEKKGNDDNQEMNDIEESNSITEEVSKHIPSSISLEIQTLNVETLNELHKEDSGVPRVDC